MDLGNGRLADLGASIGIAFANDPQETAAALLRRADSAMYAAKQAGRGCAYIAPAVPRKPSETAAA